MTVETATMYISKEGLEKLQKELSELQVQRVEITQKIKEAREFGDLSENAEYQEARTKQSFIEGRIEEIEAILKSAQVVDGRSKAKGVIGVGSEVVVKANGSEKTYKLTGSDEASPLEGKISHESPLGQALMGQKVGDKVTLETPDGKKEYTILKVG
ncbi:MAG: transcription elongation factor GreA [Patescibacteria group bacterium]|nr:transcription elongation factor GreA [Patescibacteria group bacterium]